MGQPESKETRVVNINYEDYDVYIGRPSSWGNPFTIPKYSRFLAIRNYEGYIKERLEKEIDLVNELLTLKGKRLGCYCKPHPCHGDILVKILQEY